MITVGFDFGTHQTKLCVEKKEGVELSYSFRKFYDSEDKPQYTLPSIICEKRDHTLSYGYINAEDIPGSRVIRYFKQGTFRTGAREQTNMAHTDAIYYSIWYIAFILFDLENDFGQEFSIQMGVPTDGSHFDSQRRLAVQILLSAYNLVEDKYHNNKQEFLNATKEELKQNTAIISYSQDKKDEYALLVFPEAYACLMPLVQAKKISLGMSLMIDIGGGTTDISFFTIENNKPQVYYYNSTDKGLNYLTEITGSELDTRLDSNVKSAYEIKNERQGKFFGDIKTVCQSLARNLRSEFKRQSRLDIERFEEALENRPLIYSGGGSTFNTLRRSYQGFTDVKLISSQEWKTSAIDDMQEIIARNLCPILSTSYGLSISVSNDRIRTLPFRELFRNLRNVEPERKSKKRPKENSFGKDFGGFNYMDDWDAWK